MPGGSEVDGLYLYSRAGRYESPWDKGFHLRGLVLKDGAVTRIVQRYAYVDELDYYRQ